MSRSRKNFNKIPGGLAQAVVPPDKIKHFQFLVAKVKEKFNNY